MKVQEIVTQKVVEALNAGKVPWVKPWKDSNPFNALSGRQYTGINQLILPNSSLGYLTFKKMVELGGKLDKGSKGNLVTLWQFVENKKAEKINGEYPKFPMLKYYNVFAVENIKDLPAKFYEKRERTFLTLSEFDGILTKHNVVLHHSGNSAHYNVTSDTITLPDKTQFTNELGYHKTLAHELIHWTGKRLNREMSQNKDSYALEELIAEMGAAMLLGEFGIDIDIENTASYCKTWGERISADEWLVCKAATRASKAVKYLLGENDDEQA